MESLDALLCFSLSLPCQTLRAVPLWMSRWIAEKGTETRCRPASVVLTVGYDVPGVYGAGERERTFSRGEPGYIATAGTDLGVGKWYLIKHHYKNKEIVAITLQRGLDKDEDGKDIYNIIYHVEDKS